MARRCLAFSNPGERFVVETRIAWEKLATDHACSKIVTACLSRGVPEKRQRLHLNNAQLNEVKKHATPAASTEAPDGWVSTQEAVVAYLVLGLWRTFFRSINGGTAKVSFLVDIRRYLELPDTLAF